MIPWRYLIPRGGYFTSLRVARACPEIRSHIDRDAFYSGADTALFLALLPAMLIILAVDWCARRIGNNISFQDFAAKRNEVIAESHRIVPVDEIRSRIGLPPLRGVILKKDTSDAG